MSIQWNPMAFVYIAVMYLAMALVHELGHYVVGMASGGADGTIHFGGERGRKYTVPLGKLRLRVSLGYLGLGLWFSIPYCIVRDRRRGSSNDILFYSGGSLANALLLIPLHQYLPILWSDLLAWFRGDFSIINSWGSAAAFWALCFAIIPLVPWRYRRNGLDSDGLQLMTSLLALVRRSDA
ncbi:MAG: hypothetical protein ACYCVB_02425 [Bacilli bacterium]